MEFKEYLDNQKQRIEILLRKYLPSSKKNPSVLHKAMRYSVFPGGKRIRPIMCIAAYEACDGKDDIILPVATAIELIHSYSLIHDDLPSMDNDDYRRGKPSCHKKFNPAIAILAGDALLTLGLNLLTNLDDSHVVKRLISYITSRIGSDGMLGGQILDLEIDSIFTKYKKVAVKSRDGLLKKFRYVATHKTGALIEAAFVSGAITAGANKEKISNIEKYGYFVGFLFQIVDDILDKDGYVSLFGEKKAICKAKRLLNKSRQQVANLQNNSILTQLPEYIFNQTNS